MDFTLGQNFGDLVRVLVGLINMVIPVLASVAVVVFLYGGVRFITRSGDAEGKNKDKQTLWWGIVALFVLTSIWGILQLLGVAFLDRSAVGEPTNIIPTSAR